MYKKTVIILTVTALVLVSAAVLLRTVKDLKRTNPVQPEGIAPQLEIPAADSGGIMMSFRAHEKYFYRYDAGKWKFVYLKGVNMGLTEAATDLSDPDVSYDTYREWFKLISEMNANTVRAFTVMPPQFYTALYDYNASTDNPLYLVQGIWFNENYMYECDNAFSEERMIVEAFKRAAVETVDIIHGNSDYTDYGSIKNAVYSHDVSEYLAGYILGLEWDPGFVERTNAYTEYAGYKGEYLETGEKATAFESFLCEVGDSLISYESGKYSAQSPLAFLNWATTDTLTHSNEPFPEEDSVSVNTENIVVCGKYYSGLFAAVDVYPYYPEFMNYQPEYLEEGADGTVDSYRAYIAHLRTEYSVPVIIAEFGIPTSRGTAHSSVTGMNQGGMTEQQQGEAIVSMMKSIAEEEYAGSLIFSWQDEWFKQTWNTVKYSPDNALQRTPNVQSAEQSYGLLAMEPGKTAVCFADGKDDEWENSSPVAETDGNKVYAMWDEGYLYLKIESDADFNSETLLIPIQITARGSDFASEYDVTFTEAADFLLVVNGKNNTRLLTDVYQDVFYYTYAYERGVFERDLSYENSGSGIYGAIRQFISNEIVLPLSGETIPAQYIESGIMKYGVTDYNSSKYNSLADFYNSGSITEIRIPWYLLNVMNSTCGVCITDFYVGGIDFEQITGVKVGICSPGDKNAGLYSIGYSPKEESSFHTRLKKSYYAVQSAMKDFMEY